MDMVGIEAEVRHSRMEAVIRVEDARRFLTHNRARSLSKCPNGRILVGSVLKNSRVLNHSSRCRNGKIEVGSVLKNSRVLSRNRCPNGRIRPGRIADKDQG
jgi:hypothetical protein